VTVESESVACNDNTITSPERFLKHQIIEVPEIICFSSLRRERSINEIDRLSKYNTLQVPSKLPEHKRKQIWKRYRSKLKFQFTIITMVDLYDRRYPLTPSTYNTFSASASRPRSHLWTVPRTFFNYSNKVRRTACTSNTVSLKHIDTAINGSNVAYIYFWYAEAPKMRETKLAENAGHTFTPSEFARLQNTRNMPFKVRCRIATYKQHLARLKDSISTFFKTQKSTRFFINFWTVGARTLTNLLL